MEAEAITRAHHLGLRPTGLGRTTLKTPRTRSKERPCRTSLLHHRGCKPASTMPVSGGHPHVPRCWGANRVISLQCPPCPASVLPATRYGLSLTHFHIPEPPTRTSDFPRITLYLGRSSRRCNVVRTRNIRRTSISLTRYRAHSPYPSCRLPLQALLHGSFPRAATSIRGYSTKRHKCPRTLIFAAVGYRTSLRGRSGRLSAFTSRSSNDICLLPRAPSTTHCSRRKVRRCSSIDFVSYRRIPEPFSLSTPRGRVR